MKQHGLLSLAAGGFLIWGGGTAAQAQQLQATDVPAGTTIKIDGQLDEALWQKATPSGVFRWLEVRKKPTDPVKTEFKVLKDAQNVYFGITCQEPLMAKLHDSKIGPVYEHDCVEIFLVPDGNPSSYYQFMISAGNVVQPMYFIESGNTTGGEFNTPIESAVVKGPDYWSMEVRIPILGLFRTRSAVFSDSWKVNVARERQTEAPPDYSTWSPLRGGFHEPAKFQTIGNMPRKAPRFDLTAAGFQANIVAAKAGEGTEPGGWIGNLSIPTQATAAAAGSYLLSVRCDGKEILAQRPVTVSADAGVVAAENVTIPTLGKALYEVVFASPKGEVVADALYTVRTEYSPLAIDLVEPFYGNAIFPGQDIRTVRGRVTANLSADVLANTQVKVSMAGAATTVKLRGNAAEFTLDAATLGSGEHPLIAEAICDGKVVAAKTLTLRKLEKPAGSCVYLDENRCLVVDGKPTFVCGWYGSENYMVSQALLNQYGNKPNSRFVNAWHCEVRIEAERMDRAEAASGRAKTDAEPSPRVYEAMKKLIDANRDNKNFLWYYLCDEPECRGISPVYLKYQYDFIKKHDPYHPVMIITRDPAAYTGCADVLNPHPYVNPTVNAKGVRALTSCSMKEIRKQMRTVLVGGKGRIAAWLTPQSFSYGFQDPTSVNPTFTEYRCMLWDAVANGATGFTPFMYCNQFDSPDLRIGNDFIYESLAAVEPFLLSPEKPLAASVVAPEDGVDVWCKRVDGKVFLIAVNLLDKEVSADIDIPGLAGVDELYGFREETTAKVANGKLHLSFAPYQVQLFSNPLMGQGLKSLEAVQTEIAAANAALKKPGNILYGRGREIDWTSSDAYIGSQSLYTLTDGICDAYGWANWGKRKLPAWLEMQFPNFAPAFRTLKVYSATIEDMDFLVWKDGGWQKAGEVRGNKNDVITFNFPEPVKTMKVKLVVTKVRSGPLAEAYEIEMYE